MLFWPSVKTHRIVPRAAATAVGVEMAKFDWRTRARRDGGLRDRRAHLPHDEMQEHEPGLALGVILHLRQEEPAVLGHHDRARVGQRQLGRGPRVGPDVVALGQSGSDHRRDPLGLPLGEDLHPPDDSLELGAGRACCAVTGPAKASTSRAASTTPITSPKTPRVPAAHMTAPTLLPTDRTTRGRGAGHYALTPTRAPPRSTEVRIATPLGRSLACLSPKGPQHLSLEARASEVPPGELYRNDEPATTSPPASGRARRGSWPAPDPTDPWFRRGRWRCQACGRGGALEVHHVVKRSQGARISISTARSARSRPRNGPPPQRGPLDEEG